MAPKLASSGETAALIKSLQDMSDEQQALQAQRSITLLGASTVIDILFVW